MNLTRRDMLKFGLVGGAALTLPLERLGLTGTTAERMPVSKMPAKFSQRLVRPPVLSSTGSASVLCPDRRTRLYPRYDIRQRFTVAEIMPGYKTPFFGYNGVTPGPTIRAFKGQPVVVRQANALQQPPAAPYQNVKMPSPYTSDPWQRTTSTHLHGSASLPQFDGYASDITRPGSGQGLLLPEQPGGADAVVPRPRRAPHLAERLQRAGRRCTSCTTSTRPPSTSRRRPSRHHAQGRVRRLRHPARSSVTRRSPPTAA